MDVRLGPIDDMIETNGNWQLLHKWNRFGTPFLFLLPNLCMDDEEELRNIAIADIVEYDFEGSEVIQNFLRCRPDTPFIVTGNGISDCVAIMNQKLRDVDYKHWGERFIEELDQFEIFLKACLKINEEDGDKLLTTACYQQDFWQELGKG